MTEIPCAVLIDIGVALLCRLRDSDKVYDNECHCEYAHCNEEQRSHIAHGGLVRYGADKDTNQQRGEGTGEGIEGTSGLDELVAPVAAAAQDVEHGVNNGVEHTYAEAADECTGEVHINCGAAHYLQAGKPLDHHAEETGCKGDESGLLVAYLLEHLTSGNTHEQVCCEVHHVAHHVALPDVAERCGHVGDEGNHCKDEAHCDNGHKIAVLFGLCHCFRFMLLIIISD